MERHRAQLVTRALLGNACHLSPITLASSANATHSLGFEPLVVFEVKLKVGYYTLGWQCLFRGEVEQDPVGAREVYPPVKL